MARDGVARDEAGFGRRRLLRLRPPLPKLVQSSRGVAMAEPLLQSVSLGCPPVPLSSLLPPSLLAPPLPLTPPSLRRWILYPTAAISSDRGLGIELGKPSGPVEASGALLPVRFLPGSRSAVRSLIGAPC